MDSLNSLVGLFYNLIPGALFLLATKLLYPGLFPIKEENILLIIGAVLSLFLGFLLQGINGLLKERLFPFDRIHQEIQKKNETIFKKIEDSLLSKQLIKKGEGDYLKDIFYKTENYIRSIAQFETIEEFSAKFAFWSNIFWISVFIFLMAFLKISLPSCICNPIDSITPLIFFFSFVMAWLSYFLSIKYYKSQFDVVIKTFAMVYPLDNGIKTKKKKP